MDWRILAILLMGAIGWDAVGDGQIATGWANAEELDYRVPDPDLKVIRLDSSPDDSFLSVRVDESGRIFVGGRRTLFVYDLDEAGRYRARHLLFTFPDHTWVNDIEIRGDDLYVVTVSAVYRLPGARVRRADIQAERLLWGVPNGHVHQCFHACAWGPEGDLYVSMGDPLWYYGDFSRPDHWGHWTMFFKEDPQADDRTEPTIRVGDKEWAAMPYNGVGGVFRIRPDGTRLRIFSRGLRNPCGLCFDQDGNLFTNDNDHEGLPSIYVPGRLLHVTEGSYFSWPRGWLLSKTPDRADMLPSLNEELGRFVPVLQTYYGDSFLPPRLRNNLLVARWGRRTISRFPLEAANGTFTAKEHILLEGRDQARPVGVCVGRGGRVFVTICYMAQNEGSPTYRSDLAVITRQDDPESMPFEVRPANERQSSRNTESRRAPTASQQTARIDFAQARLEELATLFTDRNSHAVQARYLACAELGDERVFRKLCGATDPSLRMAGVVSIGFRLTLPAVDARLPPDAPLTPQQKEEANIIQYADEPTPIDLRTLGRVGNYTIAEHWKALPHSAEQERLFGMLLERLEDADDKVRLQAAHFLSLLNDARSEPKIAAATADVQDKRLNLGKLEHVRPQIWMLGPVPDQDGFRTVHSVESSAIDLGTVYEVGGKRFPWKLTKATSPDRPLYNFHTLYGPTPNSSVYSFIRFDAPTAQRMQLLVGSEDGVKVWHNGKLVFTNDVVRPLTQLDDVVALDLLPGSNDVLVRVRMRAGIGGQYLHFKHLGEVKFSLPDMPDGLSLAERLKSASTGTQAIDPKFLEIDWPQAVRAGDPNRGKKLFAAESLGCAKCHAATASQAGGGGPSLADSGKRFTVGYLVESVLAPGKVISPVFKSTTVVTANGQVITGLVVMETGEKLEILLPDTKRVSINKSEIDERKFVDISAMPHGVVKTPDELRDVITYLLSNPTDAP